MSNQLGFAVNVDILNPGQFLPVADYWSLLIGYGLESKVILRLGEARPAL